jgi:hypothetical protein
MRICQIFIIVININGELVYGFESGASSDQDEVIYQSGGLISKFYIESRQIIFYFVIVKLI